MFSVCQARQEVEEVSEYTNLESPSAIQTNIQCISGRIRQLEQEIDQLLIKIAQTTSRKQRHELMAQLDVKRAALEKRHDQLTEQNEGARVFQSDERHVSPRKCCSLSSYYSNAGQRMSNYVGSLKK